MASNHRQKVKLRKNAAAISFAASDEKDDDDETNIMVTNRMRWMIMMINKVDVAADADKVYANVAPQM